MPSINMIATRRAERKKLERQVRMAALAVLSLVVVGFAIMSFMTARIYATERAIDKLDEQLASIQPTVKQIAEYEGETKKLQPRLELLADSREKTLLWYSVMQNLSRSMPDKTWLTNISTVKSAENQRSAPAASSSGGPVAAAAAAPKVNLKLRGTSVSQMMVGEAMLRLNRWPEFQQVDLAYTQQGGNPEVETIEFEINAQLLDPNRKGGVSRNVSN